ncbi:MAG: SAM-dependent methyltransferase, partial [Nocardioidaceae bacterium]
FCFEGFLPRRPAERARRLGELVGEARTMVFFEAPRRCAATLAAMVVALGAARRAAVCRELTKTYEEVRRGPLDELAAWATAGLRGEVTLVVAGAPSVTAVPLGDETLKAMVDEAVASGLSRKDAVIAVSVRTGSSRRVVYDAAHR